MFCHHGFVEMSIHSLRFPLALRAIAIWLTQGVGSVIGIRTPLSSGFWSSSCNKLWSAVGIFLGKHVDVLDSLLMHLSSLIVINFNFCTVLSPSKLVRNNNESELVIFLGTRIDNSQICLSKWLHVCLVPHGRPAPFFANMTLRNCVYICCAIE